MQKQKEFFIQLIKTGKNIAGCFLLLVWLLAFFTSPLRLSANNLNTRIYKSITPVSVEAGACKDTPASTDDPLPLPEDPEEVSEVENTLDADKKIFSTAFTFTILSARKIQSVQSVRSFHFSQAILQIIAIPLFVLQHSWKRYLL